MNWFDYVILAIVVLSVVVSVFRGFVREALAVLVWIVALWVGWTFFRDLAVHFEAWIKEPSLRFALALAVLIIGVLLVGGLITYLIGEVVDKTGLSGTDRVLGAVFGLARGVLVVAILVLFAGLTPITGDTWWQESRLVGYFEEVAFWMRGLLPEDVAEQFRFAGDKFTNQAP
ncbi:MAG: CvpA family protein [Pseudomonadota bacterium]